MFPRVFRVGVGAACGLLLLAALAGVAAVVSTVPAAREAVPASPPAPTSVPTAAPPTAAATVAAQVAAAVILPGRPHLRPVAPTTLPARPTPPVTPPPTNTPQPTPAAASVGVFFATCAQARAAGAAPLYLGQPGYRVALDRDRDGVACETT